MLHTPENQFKPTNFFAKIKCEPVWQWMEREKPLPHFDLFYVWDGTGSVKINGTEYTVQKGSCFLFRPGDFTSAVHDSRRPLTITYIHFQMEGNPSLIPDRYRLLSDTIDLEMLLTRYVRTRLADSYGAAEECKLLLKLLMIRLLRGDAEHAGTESKESKALQDAIFEAANYLHEHPALWLKVEDLAHRAQLSPLYFTRKFKELTGLTVQAYAINCRIERAQLLLRYGGMNVSAVAEMLGYQDVYFFSRQYKKYTGQNPSKDK